MNIIYFIGFILCFFPMFVIQIIPNSFCNINVGLVFWTTSFSVCALANKLSREFWGKLFKLKVIKALLIFLGYIILTSLIHYILGFYKASLWHYGARIYKFAIAISVVYLFPLMANFINVKLKTIIKIIISMIYFILVYAIIQYFSIAFHIDLLNHVYDFFTNARAVQYMGSSNYLNLDDIRIFSVFGEPGTLGRFIFIVMPIILNFSCNKYKLYKNYFIDILIRKTFIPIMIIVIFMTKSPIWFLFCIIELLILLSIKYKQYIIKYFYIIIPCSIILLSIFTILIILSVNSFENSFLNRAILVFHNFKSLRGLVLYEPSLANRILSIIISFKIFLHNMLFGVGFSNIMCSAKPIIEHINIPFTLEMQRGYYWSNPNIAAINLFIIFTLLAETGIIGLILYILFVYINVSQLRKISFNIGEPYKSFCLSFSNTIIMMFITSFYTSFIEDIIVWLIYGIALNIIYCYKYHYKNLYN